MKNLKKLVSVIVTVAMLISSFAAIGVSAADYADVEATNSYYKAIKVLSGLGIVKGDDEGNFNPTNDIKRSEMVALICRMKGEEAIATSTEQKFDDVPSNHWAAGYINWGVGSEIIKGDGDGNFRPDDSVTLQDAVVMIIRASGWERIANRKEYGGYPTGHMRIANSRGVMENIDYTTSKAATREVVAQAIYNGMTMPIVEYSQFGESVEDDRYVIRDDASIYKSILTNANKIYKVRALVNDTAVSDPAVLATEKGNMVNLDIEDVYEKDTIPSALEGDGKVVYVGKSDIADFHKYYVEAYIAWNNKLNNYEVLVAVPDTTAIDTVTVKANTNKIVGLEGDVFTYRATKKATKDIEIDLADTLEVYYNGQTLSANEDGYYEGLEEFYEVDEDTIDLAALLGTYADEITFVGEEDVYSTIFVTDYAYVQVEEVVVDDLYIVVDGLEGEINLDLEDREGDIINLYDAEGNAIELADIEEDDILNIVAPLADGEYDVNEANYVSIYVTSKAVTGTVDEDHLDGTFTIEGDVYGSLVELTAGAEGIFFITIDGKVYAADAEVSLSKNFAIILGHEVTTKFNNSVVEIQAYTAEGEIKTFTVASTIKVNGESYKRSGTGTLQTAYFGDKENYEESTFAAIYADIDYNADEDEFKAEKTANLDSRIVSYKTNDDGELTAITFAGQTGFDSATHEDDYDASKEVFNGRDVVADTIIVEAPYAGTDEEDDWNIDTDKLGITTFGALVKEEPYELNYYIINDADEIAIATLADTVGSATSGSHYAVVTGVGSVFDKVRDEAVVQYTFIQSGEVVKAKVAYGSEAEDTELEIGDVFRYGTDAEGNIEVIEVMVGTFGDEGDDEYEIAGDVTDAGTTTSGKRYISLDDSDERIFFATDDASTIVSIDTRDGSLDEADITALTSAASIKKSTSRTEYSIIALCDEDGNIIDVVMTITDAD